LPSTTVRAGAGPPTVDATTGTCHDSACLSGRSRVNSPCDSCTVVLPPLHCADSTLISGMPGCRVKSCAICVIGLSDTESTACHRSSDTALP
jgi:hypothetical protein